MRFGTELKLKKEWKYNSFITFEKSETFQVAQYEHKYGMKLHHPKIADFLDFEFNWKNRDVRIKEYFEVVESFDDRLAELEKVILDYYLEKDYEIGIGDWGFNVDITTRYKCKRLRVTFEKDKSTEEVVYFSKIHRTTIDMFNEAIEHFTIRNNKQYVIYQGDEFTPAQKIATFDNKNEADEELERIQNESCKVDDFTCFYMEEIER